MERVTGIKSGCYKLADDKIRAVIGQKSGQSSKFDVMGDQAGYDHRYSYGNYEYGRRLLVIIALPTRTHFMKRRIVVSRLCVLRRTHALWQVRARACCRTHTYKFMST